MEARMYAVLDANLNRALEGLRVCEDLMRFLAGRDDLSLRLKEARHAVSAATRRFPRRELLAARDVERDVQRLIDLPGERERRSAADLASANIHRAQEAVRVLEETSKLVAPSEEGDNPFQEIRFSLYILEKDLMLAFDRADDGTRFRDRLYAILDSDFVATADMERTARTLVRSGAGVVQLRMKSAPSGEFLAAARCVAAVCRAEGALFIVNDRPDIALLAGAAGVHLGQDDLPVAEARRVLGPGMIVGKSTHTAEQVRAALAEGPDYIAVGPVFGTSSKGARPLPAIGTGVLREACALSTVPVVAIGGITPERADELREAGCRCAAVISYLYRDGEVGENAQRISGALRAKNIGAFERNLWQHS